MENRTVFIGFVDKDGLVHRPVSLPHQVKEKILSLIIELRDTQKNTFTKPR